MRFCLYVIDKSVLDCECLSLCDGKFYRVSM